VAARTANSPGTPGSRSGPRCRSAWTGDAPAPWRGLPWGARGKGALRLEDRFPPVRTVRTGSFAARMVQTDVVHIYFLSSPGYSQTPETHGKPQTWRAAKEDTRPPAARWSWQTPPCSCRHSRSHQIFLLWQTSYVEMVNYCLELEGPTRKSNAGVRHCPSRLQPFTAIGASDSRQHATSREGVPVSASGIHEGPLRSFTSNE